MEPRKMKLTVLFSFILCLYAAKVPDDCENGLIHQRKLCFGLAEGGILDLNCVKSKTCKTLLIITVADETVSYSLKSTHQNLLTEACPETGLEARVQAKAAAQIPVVSFLKCKCSSSEMDVTTLHWDDMECQQGEISLSKFNQVEQSVRLQMVKRSLRETDHDTHPYDWTLKMFLPIFVDEKTIKQCKQQSPNCFGFYDKNAENCMDKGECRFVVFFEKVSSHVLATIAGKLSDSCWLAFGLSIDRNMGDDFVVECATASGDDTFSANVGKTNTPVMNTSGIKMMKKHYELNTLVCQYQLNESIEYNFDRTRRSLTLIDNKYHVLVAFGHFSAPSNNIRQKIQHFEKYASTGRLSSSTSRNSTQTENLEDGPSNNKDGEDTGAREPEDQDKKNYGDIDQKVKSSDEVKSNLTWIYIIAGLAVFLVVLALVGTVIVKMKSKRQENFLKKTENRANTQSPPVEAQPSSGEDSAREMKGGQRAWRKSIMHKRKRAKSESDSIGAKKEAAVIIAVKSTTSSPLTLYTNPKFSKQVK